MAIGVGDRIPEATFKSMTAEGPANITTSDIFSGKKVVFFGVPGAFTGTCHNQHVPGFLENFDAMSEQGTDTIAVVSVNDPFVMGAWAEATGAKDKLVFLSDWDGAFARLVGLDIDLAVAGLGTRLNRFSMIVDDGVVKTLNIEPSPGEAIETSAEKILDALKNL